jgi:hypothetical protein
MFRWWRKRKKEVSSIMATYDHNEISRVFGRLGGCMGCTDWRADMVRARIGAFLVAHWDAQPGQVITPPTLQDLQRSCCRAIAEGRVKEESITYDVTLFQHGPKGMQPR